MRNALLCLLVSLTVLTELRAQRCTGGDSEKLFSLGGFGQRDEFGYSVASAGDVDGDGYDDVIVGARLADGGLPPLAGEAYVFSGATNALLYQFHGQSTGELFGSSVSGAGDVDADGYDDFLIGAPEAQPGGRPRAGSVFLYSGATGALIRRFDGQSGDTLGRSVSGAGDVDGDGVSDVIFGAPNAGVVYVYSVATTHYLYQFDGVTYGYYGEAFGWAVSGAGDVDGDGRDDLIVGVPEHFLGAALVFSGATGAVLRTFLGRVRDSDFGHAVCGVGDVDGDGLDDVLVGAPEESVRGQWGVGAVYLMSVLSGTRIRQHHGEAIWNEFGFSVAGGGDVDGDGVDDMIVGAPGADPLGRQDAGAAYVFSGATGALLQTFLGPNADNKRGHAVAVIGDLNGDSRAEVLVGEPSGGSVHAAWGGAVRAHSADAFMTVDAPRLSASAGGRVTFHLDFPDTEAGVSYALLASLSGTGKWIVPGGCIPLFKDALTQQMRQHPPAIVFHAAGMLGTGGLADAWVDAPPLHLSSWSGRRAWFAAVTHDPSGIRFASCAIPIEVLP